jgi:hypothetical protein
MAKLLNWEITPYRDTLEIFEGENNRLAVLSNVTGESQAFISLKTENDSSLIKLTSGNVTFLMNPEAKTIMVKKR